MRVAYATMLCGLLLVQPAKCATSRADTLLAESKAAEQSGNREKAERLAQAAIVADPTQASSYTALGDLYLRADQSDFAAFYYSEALEVDPTDQAAQRGLVLADRASKAAGASTADSLDKNRVDQ